jgi:hypothetical protein
MQKIAIPAIINFNEQYINSSLLCYNPRIFTKCNTKIHNANLVFASNTWLTR